MHLSFEKRFKRERTGLYFTPSLYLFKCLNCLKAFGNEKLDTAMVAK